MTDSERIAALEAQIAELKKVVAPASAVTTPKYHTPYDPSARFSMPAQALAEMVAVDNRDGSIRDVVADNLGRPAPTVLRGMLPESARDPRGRVSVERGTGWRDAVPLGPPPGIAMVDRLCDAQDAIDRRERERQLGVRHE